MSRARSLPAVRICLLIFGVVPFLLIWLPVTVLAASAGVWLFFVQHQFEDTYWARNGAWNFHEAALRIPRSIRKLWHAKRILLPNPDSETRIPLRLQQVPYDLRFVWDGCQASRPTGRRRDRKFRRGRYRWCYRVPRGSRCTLPAEA